MSVVIIYHHMKQSSITSLLLSAILLMTVCACHKEDPRYEKTEEDVFAVRVFEGDLYDIGSIYKFYVRKYPKSIYWVPFNVDTDWGLEVGYEYEVSTWKHWLKEPPLYGSAIVYELREVLSRNEVEPLTKEDIVVITL